VRTVVPRDSVVHYGAVYLRRGAMETTAEFFASLADKARRLLALQGDLARGPFLFKLKQAGRSGGPGLLWPAPSVLKPTLTARDALAETLAQL